MRTSELRDAIILIGQEGLTDSPLKKQRLKKKIHKASKLPGWKEAVLAGFKGTEGREWLWRIANARLTMGYHDWDGWGYRHPRAFKIPFKYDWWDVETKIDRLLIMGEQGVGDEIMFGSLIKKVLPLAKEITFECEPRLANIFRGAYPQIEVVGRKDLNDAEWAKGRHFDGQVLLGDLPPTFCRDRESYSGKPYISIESDKRYEGRIGVSWKGRQGGFDPKRLPEQSLSLQYGVKSHDFEVPAIDLTNDLDGVFRVIAACDRIISAPTSIVHFAGAMGVPVDLIMPPTGYKHGGFDEGQSNALFWRWSEAYNGGNKSLWHDSVTIHRSLNEYLKYEKSR